MNLRPGVLSFAATGTALVASLLAYPFLPRRLATHFRANGRPDRKSARAVAALRLPVVMVGLALLNERAGAWPGGSDREDGESGVRARAQAVSVAELGLLGNHLALLAYGLSLPIDMERVPRAIYAALLIGLGNVLPKVPRNALIGIRTPWTLADPSVWERTHRFGGYLCVLAGLSALASAPASGPLARRVPIATILASTGLAAAYSWVTYRQRNQPRAAD